MLRQGAKIVGLIFGLGVISTTSFYLGHEAGKSECVELQLNKSYNSLKDNTK